MSTAMAVERWLLMGRRSVVTVWRVYITQAVFHIFPILYTTLRRLPGMKEYFDAPVVPNMDGVVGLCFFAVSSVSYFKVFRIIRRHQQQVHTLNTNVAGQPIFDLEKYKKSVYTILYIMALCQL